MNQRKRSFGMLWIGLILLAAGIALALYTYHTSYAASVATGEEISQLKAQITQLKESGQETETAGELAALQDQQDSLSREKLSQERPYSYSLILVFFALLLSLRGLWRALRGPAHTASKTDVKKLAQAGLLAALCYIGFAFFKIDIPVGTEKTSFHFGNVFCVLASLLLGGFWGGLSGAVGMTIGDLTTSYVTSAPKTFLLKLCIGLIVGGVAHGIFKLDRSHSRKYVVLVTLLSSVCGMGFNIIADPVAGYFYKTYLLGIPQDLAAALAKVSAVTTSVNALVAVIASLIFYLALRPALKKSGLLVEVTPEK